MTDRKTLASGIGCAAWGYFFLYFDFNLGTISILPDFVGMILFLKAITTLKGERRDLALLEPLGILLLLWNLADWFLAWMGGSVDSYFSVLGLIVTLASLYFHFQLLTDFAALAEKYLLPDSEQSAKMLKWRSVQTVLLTVMHLMRYTNSWKWEWGAYVTMGMAIVYLIAGLLLMKDLFALRKFVRDDWTEIDERMIQ